MPVITLPNTNTHDTSDTSSHIIVFVLLCTLIYNKHVIKHTENFSMEILLFWLPGRVAGPEVGPGQKWQGLGPALSVASAAIGPKEGTLLLWICIAPFALRRIQKAQHCQVQLTDIVNVFCCLVSDSYRPINVTVYF